MRRYVSIGFRHLMTDWHIRRQSALKEVPFVMAMPQRGRMVITASSAPAEALGIETGMVVADARAAFPTLEVVEDPGILPEKLLRAFVQWIIRFTPVVAIDPPDGLILDATGCPHLWGGEQPYLKDIVRKLHELGYDVRVAMAGTPGAAWAVARYGNQGQVINPGDDKEAILSLPPEALRLQPGIVEKLHKLGLFRVGRFIDMPRSVLRRRFGQALPDRIDQVIGRAPEIIQPVEEVTPYREQLTCLEPVRTATAIRIAIERLLEALCKRLAEENRGLQKAVLKTTRLDGKMQEIVITTHAPTCRVHHLMRLFELKITMIEPDLGIELFVLEAPLVADIPPFQERLWSLTESRNHTAIATLLDRLAGRGGPGIIHRYLPAEHHWPERSVKEARSLEEKPKTSWQTDRPRPIHLLQKPEPIEVAAPVPDYPPIHFRYKAELHTIHKSDGPERIEQEWWLEDGPHRDYYVVEDQLGRRYWIFRSGHYEKSMSKWFIHGFFA